MWDFFKVLLERILLGEFTMWLLFFLLGFIIMPADVEMFINQKTPPFFPDWLTLSYVLIFLVSLICINIYRSIKKVIKWSYEKYREYSHQKHQQEVVKQIAKRINNASEAEWTIIQTI